MRVFYIVSIILLTSVSVKSQTRSFPQEPAKVIRFYPNPAVSQITFDLETGSDRSFLFQVYNFVGKKVFESNNITQHTVVNVSDFYRGVYIFQLKDKNGKLVESGKFQVTH
jgi:hypothetical protein